MEERAQGCRRVECLLVDKIYDACTKRECLQNMTFELCLPGGSSDYTFLYAQFGDSEVEHYECEPFYTEMDECHARLKCVVAIPIYAVLRNKCDCSIITVPAKPVCGSTVQSDNKIRIPVKTVANLDRRFIRQGRFEPACEAYVEASCASKLCDGQIKMSLGFVIIVNSISKVSLRIPTFGFCEVPDECVEEDCTPNFCETFLNEDLTSFNDFFPTNRRCDCDDE